MVATAVAMPVTPCRSCGQPVGPTLFCPFCGHFVLDPNGTTVMASRVSRLGSYIVNVLLMILTLFIGWVIWWFIVAPRGQNPGKAVVGLRVVRTDGRAATTGWMFVRGLCGIVCGIIPLYLDELWLLWDKDAQTLHDKLAGTVVVRAQGSEHIVEQGSVGQLPPGVPPRPEFAPPVNLGSLSGTPPPASAPASAEGAPADQLRRLTEMRDQGLITEDEYQQKRKDVLDRI